VRRFKILEHDFSVASGELAPSMKVKRRVVYDRYRAIFDGFYEERY
jgi:long-chain acyl-CoA synthetase